MTGFYTRTYDSNGQLMSAPGDGFGRAGDPSICNDASAVGSAYGNFATMWSIVIQKW